LHFADLLPNLNMAVNSETLSTMLNLLYVINHVPFWMRRAKMLYGYFGNMNLSWPEKVQWLWCLYYIYKYCQGYSRNAILQCSDQLAILECKSWWGKLNYFFFRCMPAKPLYYTTRNNTTIARPQWQTVPTNC
jgi:hypothetical protein